MYRLDKLESAVKEMLVKDPSRDRSPPRALSQRLTSASDPDGSNTGRYVKGAGLHLQAPAADMSAVHAVLRNLPAR